jgi:hypothetical protein
MIASGHY